MRAERLPASKRSPFVPRQARCGNPGQGGAVSVGPIWHACIAICPAKHRFALYLTQIDKCLIFLSTKIDNKPDVTDVSIARRRQKLSHHLHLLKFCHSTESNAVRIQCINKNRVSVDASLGQLYTYRAKYVKTIAKYTKTIARYAKTIAKCEKQKAYGGLFPVILFTFCPLFSLFAFHSILPRKKLKDFVVYIFAALIKHEIRMKYEKCIASVLYFVEYFAKTFTKYPHRILCANYGFYVKAS